MAFFQNSPSETTPLSADNLSRSERYLTATAGADGKFYVNIDGADGLADGDTLKIKFPAATNGASNAEFSIDGGTTYKNVFYGAVQLKAVAIESQHLELRYDGTQFLVSKLLPQAICLFRATMSTNTETANTEIVNFDTAVTDVGGDYDTTDKKFTAPVDGYYQFYVSVTTLSTTDQDRYGFKLFKNGATDVKTLRLQANGTTALYVSGSYLVLLEAGDYIQIQYLADSTKTISSTNHLTWFEGYLVLKT